MKICHRMTYPEFHRTAVASDGQRSKVIRRALKEPQPGWTHVVRYAEDAAGDGTDHSQPGQESTQHNRDGAAAAQLSFGAIELGRTDADELIIALHKASSSTSSQQVKQRRPEHRSGLHGDDHLPQNDGPIMGAHPQREHQVVTWDGDRMQDAAEASRRKSIMLVGWDGTDPGARDARLKLNRPGYRAVVAWAGGFGEVEQFGIEGTGSNGVGLTRCLRSRGIEVLRCRGPSARIAAAAASLCD